MADKTIRAGAVTATVDLDEMLALIDRVTDGAATTFVSAARRIMDDERTAVQQTQARWSDDTGASRAGLRVVASIKTGDISVSTVAGTPYTYKIKYSALTAADIEADATELANRTWAKLGPIVDRGNTVDSRRKLARRHMAEASGGALRGWWPRVDPSVRALRDWQLSRLHWLHGRGAPSQALAGRHLWSTQVARPLKVREAELVDEVRDAVNRLAQEG